MNRIKVNLLHVTPVETILNAIGKPYKTESPSLKLIEKICLGEKGLTEHHGSVLEHTVFSFEILGSSRAELQEHMRHRLASPTVESTRFSLKKILDDPRLQDLYTLEGREAIEELFVFPEPNRADPKFSKMNSSDFEAMSKLHYHMIEECIGCLQEAMARGIPNDLAKYLLVESFRTNFTWTINLRSLLNFLRLRHNPSAHFEIRHIARLIVEEINTTWVGKVLADRI